MTAPINFPTLQAPQVVPGRNTSDGFAEFLAALQGQREERAARREQLDLQRMQYESSAEIDKLTKAQKLKELEIAGLNTQAEEAAAPYVLELLALGDKGDEVAALDIARRMNEQVADKKLKPYLNRAFSAGVKSGQEGLSAIAQRRTEEANALNARSKAKVQTTTESDQISLAESQAAHAKNQLDQDVVTLNTAKVQLELANLERTYGPGASSFALGVLQGGGTLGMAYKLRGIPLPAGVDPNFKLPGAGGSGGAEQAKQEGLASQALAGNTLIELANNQKLSVKADAFRSLAGKSGIIGAIGRHILNPKLTPEERQVLQGYQLMGQAYAQHVTGATATDSQMQLFQNTIVSFADDDPETDRQKIAMRRLIPQLIARGLKPSQIASAMVDEAVRVGMSPQRLAILRAQVPLAAAYEKSDAYNKTVPPVVPDSSRTASRYTTKPVDRR